MKLIDVTVPLDGNLPTYPGNTPFEIEAIKRIARGGMALLRSAFAQHHPTRPMKPHAIQPISATGVAIGLGCADGGLGLVVVDAGNPLCLSTFATP